MPFEEPHQGAATGSVRRSHQRSSVVDQSVSPAVIQSGLCAETIRRLALHDTELAHAQVGTLRLKLLKIGAIILRNTRRIRFLLSSTFPYQNLFYAAAKRLVPG